jgi:hypothetical protein
MPVQFVMGARGWIRRALEGLPAGAELREQLFHIWSNWMGWAVANPEKRRALAQLGVSDEITPVTRTAGGRTMAGIKEFLERCHANGAMREASMGFFGAIMSSLADTTMDFMIQDPANADKHCEVGFTALWRVIG